MLLLLLLLLLPANAAHAPTPTHVPVKKVHMVFMNHYDAGFKAEIQTINNWAFHQWFARAGTIADQVRANTSNKDTSIWTSDAWIVALFLQCSSLPREALTLNNPLTPPLICPNATELASFKAHVHRGDIVWHAAPTPAQAENQSPELFEAGLRMARQLDLQFYGRNRTTVYRSTDVPQTTRATVPLLRKHGMEGISIGSNPDPYYAQVPKLFRWLDPESGQDVIFAFHPGGYGGNNKDGYKPASPCRSHGLPGEKRVCGHCAAAPNGVAMCSQFNGDNDGPDGSGSDVEASLSLGRAAYPNATVIASSFDDFIRDVLPVKDQLPTVTQEIGDTWIHGVASDPLKMAQHREIQRQWIACMKSGEASCQHDDKTIERMTLFLHKAPDHTWGCSSDGGDFNLGFPASQKLGHNGVRDYTKLNLSRLLSPPFAHNAGTFAAQRYYNELAVMALEADSHILATPVRAAITRMTEVAPPSTRGMSKLTHEPGALIQLEAATVAVGANGALTTLRSRGGVEWASARRAMAQLVYRVYNDTDFNDFGGWYGPRGYWPFCKANDNVTYMLGIDSNNNSESSYFLPTVTALYANVKSSRLVVQMSMPSKAVERYGSFRTAFLDVNVSRHSNNDQLEVALSLTWLGKQPVMIGESISLLFAPAPALSPGGLNSSSASAWTMNKLGSNIDPENVVQGGNQHNHAVWKGVVASTAAGEYELQTLDAPIVNPMTDRPASPDPSCAHAAPIPGGNQKLCYGGNASYPFGHAFPAGSAGLRTLAKGSVFGMASNLYNNLWGTNYPQFYPYPDTRYCAAGPLKCKNADAEFRYVLKLGGKTPS
eukprot:COSAG05_NODE_254_length_12842_cov_140.995292_1_plen_827_part_00